MVEENRNLCVVSGLMSGARGLPLSRSAKTFRKSVQSSVSQMCSNGRGQYDPEDIRIAAADSLFVELANAQGGN